MSSTKNGGMGIRTPDLLIANETLYQLSYTPFENNKIALNADVTLSLRIAAIQIVDGS
jgi:hypothetical protein